MKGNNLLYLIFFVLLGIYVLSKLINQPVVRSFESVLISVDTSTVSEIVIYPKTGADPIHIKRSASQWTSQAGNLNSTCPPNIIKSMLGELTEVETKRLVSRSSENWSEYSVSLEEGTRVEVKNGQKTAADFVIGRFNFNQERRSPLSYMRKTDSDDTYAIEGFIGLSFDQEFDNFRDKRILNEYSDDIGQINLATEQGQFSLTRGEAGWTANGVSVDSTAIAQYLNSIVRISGSNFYDGPTLDFSTPSMSIEVTSSHGPQRVDLIRGQEGESPFYVRSSYNDSAVFASDSSGVYRTIFGDILDLVGAQL